MKVQTLHISLPEAILQRLQRVAKALHQPLEVVVVQTICGNLPPAMDDLSPASREVVADLPTLSDEALWAVARVSMPPQWRRHQRLLQKAQKEMLTAAEQQELETLRTATDRFVTRRSYALALLKWHGHTLPAEG